LFKYDDNSARIQVTDEDDITTSYYFDSNWRLVGYGESDDDITLLNYGQFGQLLQVARGKQTGKVSSNGTPVFQVTELLTPLNSP
jgi:hypothetical protein